MGSEQLVARVPQLARRRRLRADRLVGRPRRHRRLAQRGDLRGLVAAALLAQTARQRVASRDELVARQPVELVGHDASRKRSTARTRRWESWSGGRPSLVKIEVTCFSTARSVTTSALAIA